MTDKQLDELLKIFQKRMQRVTDEYLKRMGEQLKDIGELIPSAETRLIQMKRLKMNVKYIQKAIAEASDRNIEDIAEVFEAIAADNIRFAEAYFGVEVAREFLMQPLMAQFKATAGEMANLSRTTIESDLYRDAVDKGIQAAQAGVEDYKSAIRRVLKEASAEGLRVVYPNGRTKRLDSAVRQNVLDGIRKLNQANMEMLGEEFGADGVEISAHMMCAEDHLPYQGKQFSNAQFAAIQADLNRPFGEWNCRHSWNPIILGVSQPAYSDEELREFAENSNEQITIDGKTKTRYQWTQEQRKIETAIRYQQDMATAAKAAGDDVLKREAKRNISDLNSYYQKIVDAADVPARPERMGTYYGKASDGLKRAGGHDIINASGALNGFSEEAEKHAEQYYAAVRKMRTDVRNIARNTGWKESAVSKVKAHVFTEKHMLDGEMRYFHPSYYMAQSWQRLIQGGKQIREQDIVLLKHELYESILEKRGYSHEEAHEMAEEKHNYAKYIPKEDYEAWLD